jgi:hypothetical protein
VSSSPWAAATPARSSPASGTSTGPGRPRRPDRRRHPPHPRRDRAPCLRSSRRPRSTGTARTADMGTATGPRLEVFPVTHPGQLRPAASSGIEWAYEPGAMDGEAPDRLTTCSGRSGWRQPGRAGRSVGRI